MSRADSQICKGSGRNAGSKTSRQVAATCPACGRKVAISYVGRLVAHGVPRGHGTKGVS